MTGAELPLRLSGTGSLSGSGSGRPPGPGPGQRGTQWHAAGTSQFRLEAHGQPGEWSRVPVARRGGCVDSEAGVCTAASASKQSAARAAIRLRRVASMYGETAKG